MLFTISVQDGAVPHPATDAVPRPRRLPLLLRQHPLGPQDPLQRGKLRQEARLVRQLNLPHLHLRKLLAKLRDSSMAVMEEDGTDILYYVNNLMQ